MKETLVIEIAPDTEIVFDGAGPDWNIYFRWDEYHSGNVDYHQSTSVSLASLLEILRGGKPEWADQELLAKLDAALAASERYKYRFEQTSRELEVADHELRTLKAAIRIVQA